MNRTLQGMLSLCQARSERPNGTLNRRAEAEAFRKTSPKHPNPSSESSGNQPQSKDFFTIPHVLSTTFRSATEMRQTARDALTRELEATSTTWAVIIGSFLTIAWSIFTPPHQTFPVRVLLFQPIWAVRMYIQDIAWIDDLILGLSLHAAYRWCIGAWQLPSPSDLKWLDLDNHVLKLYLQIFSLLGACGVLAGGIVPTWASTQIFGAA